VTDRLAKLRAEIAAVDAELLALVAHRLALVREVGSAKRAGRACFPDTLSRRTRMTARPYCTGPRRLLA